MKKPIYISCDLYQHLDRGLYQELEVYNKFDNDFWTGSRFIAHPRYGDSNVWNFSKNIPITDNIDLSMKFNQRLSDVSDMRAMDFLNLIVQTNKRLSIFWSGGIDSTLIIAAIIKNFPRYLLDQIDIYMNHYSFFENPDFFYRVIMQNNLRCINVDSVNEEKLESIFSNSIVTDGEPADKLWVVQVGLSYFYKYGESNFSSSFFKGKQQFVEFLQSHCSERQANFYYDYVVNNIKDVNAPVESMADLFWWINYNYHWIGHLMGWYMRHRHKNNKTWELYQKNYHAWYNTAEYQYWSFNDTKKDRVIFENIGQYKIEAKQYIYDIFKNDYFLNYKTKIASGQRGPSRCNGLAIFDDGTELSSADISEFVNTYCLIK